MARERTSNQGQMPKRGQHHRAPSDMLSPLGQFVERMLTGVCETRYQQSIYMGAREDIFGELMMGSRTPSRAWLNAMGWPEKLAQTQAWKADPEKNAAEFATLLADLYVHNPFEIEPAKEGTLGKVIELAFPAYSRLEQALALGMDAHKTPEAATHFMRQIATDDHKISQQNMAVLGMRSAIKERCLTLQAQGHAGLWDRVGALFDDIAVTRIADRATGGNKEILAQWSAAMGEVFADIRNAHGLTQEHFLQSIGGVMYGSDDAHTRLELYQHAEAGGWFSRKGMKQTYEEPYRMDALAMTRAQYLDVATRITKKYLADADTNAKQSMQRDRLENFLPEIAVARRARPAAPQV